MGKLRRMVALSSAFRTRAAIDYPTALTRVWTEYVPNVDELMRETKTQTVIEPLRPCASIWPMSTAFDGVGGGDHVYTIPQGMMHLYLSCEPLDTLIDWNDRREEAIGFLDQWFTEIMAISGSGVIQSPDTTNDGEGYLTIKKAGAAIIDHVPFKTQESTGDIFFQQIALQYGDEA